MRRTMNGGNFAPLLFNSFFMYFFTRAYSARADVQRTYHSIMICSFYFTILRQSPQWTTN